MFKIAIVGCGKMGFLGGIHKGFCYTHAEAWKKEARAEIVAVCDLDGKKSEAAALALGCPHYESIHAMLRQAQPQIVSLVTPTAARTGTLGAVLCGTSVLGVWCEKPLAGTVADAGALLAQAATSGIGMQVNYWRRFDLVHQQIREDILGGPLKDTIERVRILYRGGMLENGCHFVDLMRWWGVPFQKVDFVETDEWDGRCLEVEIQARNCRIRLMEGGLSFTVEGPNPSEYWRVNTWQRWQRVFKTDPYTMKDARPPINFMETAAANLVDHLETDGKKPLLCPASEAYETLRQSEILAFERGLKW